MLKMFLHKIRITPTQNIFFTAWNCLKFYLWRKNVFICAQNIFLLLQNISTLSICLVFSHKHKDKMLLQAVKLFVNIISQAQNVNDPYSCFHYRTAVEIMNKPTSTLYSLYYFHHTHSLTLPCKGMVQQGTGEGPADSRWLLFNRGHGKSEKEQEGKAECVEVWKSHEVINWLYIL